MNFRVIMYNGVGHVHISEIPEKVSYWCRFSTGTSGRFVFWNSGGYAFYTVID